VTSKRSDATVGDAAAFAPSTPRAAEIRPTRIEALKLLPTRPMKIVMVAPALNSAVRGMVDAGRRLDTGAHNIANASTEPFSPLRPDGSQGAPGSMDLVDEMVDTTVLAPAAYAANARVVRAADETRGALLDIRA
jgi:hypothetical protein